MSFRPLLKKQSDNEYHIHLLQQAEVWKRDGFTYAVREKPSLIFSNGDFSCCMDNGRFLIRVIRGGKSILFMYDGHSHKDIEEIDYSFGNDRHYLLLNQYKEEIN